MRKLQHCDLVPATAPRRQRHCHCPLVQIAYELVPLRVCGHTRVLPRPWWHCPDCRLAMAVIAGRGLYSTPFRRPRPRPRPPRQP